MVIDKEFLDAKWSTGEKKISYEASVLVNESENTIYIYEKTTETGSGFGFGMSTDSSVQTGTTLFRKVKAVTYGPEGEVINIEIDLGTIPKTIKEIAKANGLKFKTVIFKKKAQYPGGIKPVAVTNIPKQELKVEQVEQMVHEEKQKVQPIPQMGYAQSNAQQPQQSQPNQVKTKTSVGLIVGISVLSAITALLYLLLGVNIIGWILGAGVIAGVFFLAKKIGNPIVNFVLLIPAFVVLFFIMAFTMKSTGDDNGGTFGKKMDNSKNLLSYELKVPSPWTQPEPSQTVYSKLDGSIYSSFHLFQTNDQMEDDFYNKDSKEYENEITDMKGYIKTDKIKIGKWDAIKLKFVDEEVDVTSYIYFINVPGKIDLYGMVASASSETDKVAKECEGYMAKIDLKY